jgi:hypothetical protein
VTDPFAHLKENRWREMAEIDDRLERGEIDEPEWHSEMARLVVPAYFAADTPLLRRLGFHPAGGARRSHPEKLGMEYRIVWVDA